ncbi:hypothetical protein L218DRAFT_985658 [Marasmius fiardii PR-910]|nr:hypothetical protein L218DRAFT_985658 [Marasmius fiardii PR-910]
MSSKRGRKRNDNLPPNRARDVQRAFRARRAAHLTALEQRVSELEEENSCLRQALNLPAANRPPLGKGPTGKDKPKPADSSTIDHHISLPLPSSFHSRDSSSSPSSTRLSSHSPPNVMNGSIGAVQVDDSVWEQTIIMSDSELPSSSASSSYPLPPMSAPPPDIPSKVTYHPFSNGLAPSSLPSRSLSSPVYMNSPPSYTHSAERPLGNGYNTPSYTIRGDIPSRTHLPYTHTVYQSHEHPTVGSGPSPQLTTREPLPYPHRRSMTEPQQPYTINQVFPHLPVPTMSHQGIRLPSPPRLQDGHGVNFSNRDYDTDGRINSIS